MNGYYTPVGPGPGFFPFWLGLLLALFCAALLADSFRNRPVATLGRFVPPCRPLAQIVTTLAAIAAFALFVQRLGFAITMLGVLLALLLVHGCRLFPTAILVALAGSFGVGLAFTHFLGVYLPPAHAGRHYFRFRDLMAHLSRENGVWRGATRQQIGRLLNGLGTEGADVGKTTKVLKGKQSEVRWVRDGLFAQAGTVPLPAGREDPI